MPTPSRRKEIKKKSKKFRDKKEVSREERLEEVRREGRRMQGKDKEERWKGISHRFGGREQPTNFSPSLFF